MKCKDCNIEMEVGKFIKGSEIINFCNASPNIIKDKIILEDCYKCPKCGRSETIEEK